MAIADLTITNEELEGKKISDIVGDTLTGTPAQNKQKFDDYSDVLKEKFNDLIDELVNLSPQNNVLEGVQVNGIDLTVSGKKVNIPLTTTTNDGAMSIADKTKLNGLNKTTSVTSGGTGIPTSGAVYSAIQSVAGIASDTGDFVVSYDNWVVAQDSVWKVRKWNSGFCEAWLDDFSVSFGATGYYELPNGMYIMGVENTTDYSIDGIYYPDNLFVNSHSDPPVARFYITHAESLYARLSYICPRSTLAQDYNKRTSAIQIVCARKPSDSTTYDYKISIYATGWWR